MTLDEIKSYLKVDINDDDDFINEILEASEAYLDSKVGEGYKTNEKGIKLSILLNKKYIHDMYFNRSLTVSDNVKQNIMVTNIEELLVNMNGDTV